MLSLPILSQFSLYFTGVLNSYAQVFFSKSKVFACIILAVTFMDWASGVSALIMVMLSQLWFRLLGFDQIGVKQGLYGLNSLLVGLCLANFFSFNPQFVSLLVIASLLSCFVTIWLVNQLGRKKLPFLSLPFLVTIWVLLLAVRDFSFISLNEKGVFFDNEMYALGGMQMVEFMEKLETTQLPTLVQVYLRSLGAIFFQSNILAGALIGIGLFLFSRIAFLLSLLGFIAGYAYANFVGDDIGGIHYGHIGFNFILSSIALAGFFLIPTRKSFLFCLVVTPLIAVMNSAFSSLFAYFQLPIYSLPFNAIVVLVLYVLQSRIEEKHLILTKVQYGSPEKNLYSYANYVQRFDPNYNVAFQMPFYGNWRVSQGHNGPHTHQLEWQHAWDFDLVDGKGLSYRDSGARLEHYYCYKKTILAPATGEVVAVLDGVKENPVGVINQEQNWGNTVVIKHNDELYSQLSHLQNGSISCKEGDWVQRGTPIALLGNSGRSPYPHLHFQFQRSPFIGSETIPFPLSNYLNDSDDGLTFVDQGTPVEGEQVGNISVDESLKSAFSFVPGKTLHMARIEDSGGKEERWKVKTNIQTNQNYLHCEASGSYAYFVQDTNVFYFTDYIGPKDSLLYYFYLGANKILLGAYEELTLNDHIPVHHFLEGPLKSLQDLIAPFAILYRIGYSAQCQPHRENFRLKQAEFQTEVVARLGNIRLKSYQFQLTVESGRLTRFEITTPNAKIQAVCIDC